LGHSKSEIYIHITFATKNREPFMIPKIRKELHLYIAKILKSYNSDAIIIGGVTDHIHILCMISKNITVGKLLEEIKRNSSKWMKTKGISNFYWQNGYYADSVSKSNLGKLVKYIVSQEDHHNDL